MRALIRDGSGKGGDAGRDLRADFFRGVALWFIFIDHIPGNVLGQFTLRNVALADATEAFVLLAGYAAAIAYGSVQARNGWGFAAVQCLRRVMTLYVAHVFLFVVFTAQVGYSAAALGNPAYLDELQLDPFGEDPYRAMLEALLLRYQPAFLDILPLYIVLLAMLAAALPLLGRPALLLAVSFGIYAAVRLSGTNLPTWAGGGWFFNPLAWQALFFVGCAMGHAPRPGARNVLPAWHPALAAAAMLLLAVGAVTSFTLWHRPDVVARLPEGAAWFLAGLDKTSLHPARLATILALAFLIGHGVPAAAAWLRSAPAAPFLLLGQHGLPVFCAGIFLSFLGRLAVEALGGATAQVLVNVAGFAALLAVAAVGAWLRLRSRGNPAAGRNPGLLPGAGVPTTPS